MQVFTAGEVNASLAKHLAKFLRDAPNYGPDVAALARRAIPKKRGFGDASPFSFPLTNALPDLSTFTPAGNSVPYTSAGGYTDVVSGVPFYSAVPANVVASQATASPTLTSTLDQLLKGVNALANGVIGGATSYYGAQSALRNIQGAAAAGVPVDVYTASRAGTGTVNTLFPNGTFLGMPLWVIVGGLAVFLISGERRRR